DQKLGSVKGAIFYIADLRKADLREAYLQGASFYQAKLQGIWFHQAQLQGAALYFAHLEGASLRCAKLQVWRTLFKHESLADVSADSLNPNAFSKDEFHALRTYMHNELPGG